MSKMKDMAMTIEELRSAAAAINDVADWLTQQFSGNADEPKEQPKKEPELKLEDVRAVLADMSRKGHTAEIRALLQKYGAAKLSGVDPQGSPRPMRIKEATTLPKAPTPTACVSTS